MQMKALSIGSRARALLLWSSLLTLFLSLSTAKHIPAPFPASAVRPEQLLRSRDRGHDKSPYEAEYFTQTLDHFNFNPPSYKTFQQRYLINRKHWGGPDNNSPIFVYTGNEGDIEWFAQNTGFMFETAPFFKALIVFIEHRYYGKSIPFGGNKDVAYSNTSTLGYLTSTQALADYAAIIIDLKRNLSAADSPVVAIGGSYGGMLAAWFRLKYPHIAIGALASSSPILNFDNITSPYSFNNIVTRDFRVESENCYKVIKGSWQQIDAAAKNQPGRQELRKSFRLCGSNGSANGDAIKSWLMTALIYTAMTDYPTNSNFLKPLPAYPVRQMCKAIDDPTRGNDTFGKLYRAASVYYNSSGQVSCFNPNDDSDPHGLNGWTWQACTEMVLPTSGNTAESLFPASEYSYENWRAFCESYFEVEPRPNWITTEFGGHDIERVLKRFGSNIIFFNGLRDPWSGGGVLKNISTSIVAIVAKEGAHHVDLRHSTSEDPEWLREVRKQEVHAISNWISQYYQELALAQ
ncbi:hypothetical protein SAY87_024093 [Trapa incisa]|uniref:Lysosomal Pro-X carboxypeptidase n=1 Tax=Trapa incisa TaxID=236973 RepID=A0AAN7QRW8_9MYRT|nr:hypothetical protein SAY87_024093 [Trapa incisa]